MTILKTLYALLVAIFLLTACTKSSEDYPSGIEHVIVIGVDGLSPDGTRKANTPVIDSMIANRSIKWNVRTVPGNTGKCSENSFLFI